MWEEYKETFDGVHASQRLKAEVLNMKREENVTRRRRIPAAALAAALVVILAGTALAVEYFGKVDLAFVESFFGGKDGYFAYGPGGSIPADSFSEKVLALCAGLEPGETAYIPFHTWSEAEEYLGIELADNDVLDQLAKYSGIIYEGMSPTGHPEKRKAHCLLTIYTDRDQHLPTRILLDTTAIIPKVCTVSQWVQLATDAAGEGEKTGLGTGFQGETDFQEYITPSGLEVTIYSSVVEREKYDQTMYLAHFVKNDAFFTVEVFSNRNDCTGESRDPWEVLIEILDAYE